jgi:hypothetical protein
MKVGRRMIVVVHSDHDAEKDTESGRYHSILLNFPLRRRPLGPVRYGKP